MPRFPLRATFGTFFAVRGTHLAAMVAYFALASIVPLVFLALALLGLFGRVDESSSPRHVPLRSPPRSLTEIVNAVRAVQDNARTLGILGAVFLLWSSLSLFSALESAFNIVYGRPNRPFLRGKALALGYMGASLVVLFAGWWWGPSARTMGRYAPDAIGNRLGVAATIVVSALALFVFLLSAYFRLTNARVTRREVIPGAIVGAVALELALQGLPLFVRVSSDILALRALGATFLLLIWLYVLANVIVFGAALNWQLAYGRTGREVEAKRPEVRSGERLSECRRRASPVRMLGLPVVAELGDRSRFPLGDEDRVVAEPFARGSSATRPGMVPATTTSRPSGPSATTSRRNGRDGPRPRALPGGGQRRPRPTARTRLPAARRARRPRCRNPPRAPTRRLPPSRAPSRP